MAHEFDTGLTGAQRTLVRNAIVSRLSGLLKANGGYLHAIKKMPRRYRGEGDESGADMIERTFQGREPSVGVALARMTFEPADLEAHVQLGELEVAVYVFGGNQRDPAHVDGRLAIDVGGVASDLADPGIDIMLEHVQQLLLGQELGINGVQEMRIVEEDELVTAEPGSVWEQIYRVKLERAIDPNRDAADLITSLEGRHRLDGIPVGVGHPLDPLVTTVANLPPEEP